MIVCPKCGKELRDDVKFCDDCGTQISETVVCPGCGRQISDAVAFCPDCGVALNEPIAALQTELSAAAQPAADAAGKKKFSGKWLLLAGIGVAVAAALVFAFNLFLGGGAGEEPYALYLKDSEIFFTDLKKNSEAWQLTSRLVDEDIEKEELADAGYVLGLLTCMSEDGTYIFFPDKVSDDDDGYNLYYREVAAPDAEPIKVDSGIRSYTVNAAATLVTYLKGEEGNLYQYQIGEDTKDKIAGEVRAFEVSDDGKKIGYLNSENSIYLKYAGQEKEKIASDIDSLEYISEDFTTVYYMKEGTLYRQVEGTDRVKIASDVSEVIKIYDSGEAYYYKNDDAERTLMEYVTDDLKAADVSCVNPDKPDYPSAPERPYRREYDTSEEYTAAYEDYTSAYAAWEEECDRIQSDYTAAKEAYAAKESRDQLRKALSEAMLGQFQYSLCFYNGAEETVLTDALSEYSYLCASDVPVIVYEAYASLSTKPVKLSEIETVDDAETMFEAALSSSSERYVAVAGTATAIAQEKEAKGVRINASGTMIYYIDNIPEEKNYGDLYRISISNGVPGKPEVYDNDVYTGGHCFISDTEFQYFKDYKDGQGELYINKDKIGFDVEVYRVSADSELGKVFYFTDWDDDRYRGTLRVYDRNESVKIADDVQSYSAMPDGRVLYLCDYSLNYYKGELREWSDGETKKIDDDVICMIPISDSKYRGYTYGW